MLCEDIRTHAGRLGELAGRLPQEDWELVRTAKNNLLALADCVEQIERHFVPAEAAETEEVPQ